MASQFAAQTATFQSPIPLVQCPDCGATMRLSQIVPGTDESRKEISVFDCRCGFEYRQNDKVRHFE
jgi:predicted RNA-binding Zn-ribbon protein involved in translation (DUF1610 family)